MEAKATLDDYRVAGVDGDRVSFVVEKGLMRGEYGHIRTIDVDGIELPLEQPVPMLSHYDCYGVRRPDAVKVSGRWHVFRDGVYPPGFPFDALAMSPRNCDVGTAEEQIERFNEFCDSEWRDGSSANCGNCPLWVSGTIGHNCQIRWAQMPYEEGGAK